MESLRLGIESNLSDIGLGYAILSFAFNSNMFGLFWIGLKWLAGVDWIYKSVDCIWISELVSVEADSLLYD